jgi:hypothetical protein
MRLAVAIVAGVVIALAVGVSYTVLAKASGDRMVWCAGPGETVDAAFKQEYPELRMSRSACDAVNGR